MTLLALGLLLVAAFMHATWNLLSKRVGGGLAFTWLFGVLSSLFYLPFVIGVIIIAKPRFNLADVAFIVISALLHFGYFIFLQQGYRVGDLSLVYPLAGGTGPALATIGAMFFLGERPEPIVLIGTGLVAVSVFLITGGFRAVCKCGSHPAICLGLATGGFIAVYTLVDKYAVSTLVVSPIILDWSSSLLRAVALAPTARKRGREVRHLWRNFRRETLGVAILNPLAYLLILFALSFTPVSRVAPARQMSILVGTYFGARILSEGDGRRRMLASGIMVLGIAALMFG